MAADELEVVLELRHEHLLLVLALLDLLHYLLLLQHHLVLSVDLGLLEGSERVVEDGLALVSPPLSLLYFRRVLLLL